MSAALVGINGFLHEGLKKRIVLADVGKSREIRRFLVSLPILMTKRTPIIGGNWKMNTDLESGMLLAGAVADQFDSCDCCDVVLYPPFLYLQAVDSVIDQSMVSLGAQDIWHAPNGAFTGEISADMLKEIGVTSVLIGHSERRHVLGESEVLIAKKMKTALAGGFLTVLCVGETLEERESGNTLSVVLGQVTSGLEGVVVSRMESVVIAYEPVWAIGTGKTASPEDAQTVHKEIRECVRGMYDEIVADTLRIQYGGSVKPDNAAELFACSDIDGALVGGASLSADSFNAIVAASCKS
jgi:triosephosphate isomerase